LELKRQIQSELEKQKQLELERQIQLEFEKQKQLELKRQIQLEFEKQKQLELKRQIQLEFEKQKQLEFEKQKQLELEKQKQLELERQIQLELEKQKQLELERQIQLEFEKQKQLEFEKQKQLELERQIQLEFEKQKQLELERQKQLELEKQKQLELERQIQLEFERQIQLEFEKQKQLELEKENKINLEYIEDLKKNKEYKQKQLDIIEFNKITEKSYITNTIISKQPEKINKLKNFDSYLHYCTSTILLKNKVIPLVTIIVPMYNVELYINNCIISLLNQSYDNIEIILVDDCSIDNTKKIADDFGEKYPLKIKVIHNQKNMGTYKSINNGIVISSGEYITIIGADDQFTVNKVEKQVKILISNLNYVACFCEYKRIHYITKKVLLKNVGESTIMFRRKIIEKIGYYDSVRFGADSEYYDRIKAVYGKNRTFIIKNVLYLALYRPNSLISSGISIDGSIFRSDYIKKYSNWHNICKNLYIEYPLQNRPFEVANELL
jgi:hypothetical protein